MLSRDALTRAMGDPFGGIGSNARATFALAGDPGIGKFLGKVAKGVIKHYTGISLPSRRSPSSLQFAETGVGPGAEVGANVSGAMVRRGMSGLQSRARSVRGGVSATARLLPGMVHPRRRRHMNVGNIRALRRAERRVASFVKLAHRIVTFHKTHHLKRGRGRRR